MNYNPNNLNFLESKRINNLNKSQLLNINSPKIINQSKQRSNSKEAIKNDLNNSNVSYSNNHIDKIKNHSMYNNPNQILNAHIIDLSNTSLDKRDGSSKHNKSCSYNPTNSTRINNSSSLRSPIMMNNENNETTLLNEDVIVLSFDEFMVEENEVYEKFRNENSSKWYVFT